jgi:hypothetical protein
VKFDLPMSDSKNLNHSEDSKAEGRSLLTSSNTLALNQRLFDPGDRPLPCHKRIN